MWPATLGILNYCAWNNYGGYHGVLRDLGSTVRSRHHKRVCLIWNREEKYQILGGRRYARSGPQSPHFSSSSFGWRGCVAKHLGQQQGLWWGRGTGSIPLKKTPIAMWPGTNRPTRRQNSLCRCIHAGPVAPTSWVEKRRSLSLTPQLAFRTLVLRRSQCRR